MNNPKGRRMLRGVFSLTINCYLDFKARSEGEEQSARSPEIAVGKAMGCGSKMFINTQ
jgi:hypothetical protein